MSEETVELHEKRKQAYEKNYEKFLNKSKFPDEIKLSLTVVHLDDFDYQENTLPDNWFRS